MLAGELVMRCFHARTAAHVMHLRTKSYSVHMALNTFYEDIVPLTDTFAETYQGDYGIIDNFPPQYKPYVDPIELMKDLSEWIGANRKKVCDGDDTYLQNIIDEIVALIRQTQYKLQNLK